MNKREILYDILYKSNYSKDDIELLQDLEEAKDNWKVAMNYFEFVSDSRLVDYAIFKEEAAKAKYMYLLKEVKKRGIEIGYQNIFLSKASDLK